MSSGLFEKNNTQLSSYDIAVSGLSPGVATTVFESDPIAVATNDNAIKAIIKYGAPTPDRKDTPTRCLIYAVIEERDSAGNWTLLQQQNQEFNNSEINPERRIVVDPTITQLNPGVDEQVYPGFNAAAISNHQGRVTGDAIRLVIKVVDNGVGQTWGDPPVSLELSNIRIASASWEVYGV